MAYFKKLSSGATQICVKHRLLPKPFWATFDDEKQARDYAGWLEGLPLHPRYCKGVLPKIDPELIKSYMCTIPGAPLIQGEWEKHGACTFATPDAYLAKIRMLTESLILPEDLMAPTELIDWMQNHNTALKGRRLDFDGKHTELHICYSTSWEVIDCPVLNR